MSQTITVPTVGVTPGFTAEQTYTYDSLNRLKSATEIIDSQTTWEQVFTFDRYGNRNFDEAETTTLPKSCLDGSNPVVCVADRKISNPSVDASNNRLSSTDNYVYDSSGNTIEDAQGRQFTYDAEDKQVVVKDQYDSTIGQYFYDGDGKRIKKIVPDTGEVMVFVYDAAGKLIGEYSTVVASSQEAKVAYLTNDNLGSPRINTDQNGAVTARHDYRPFGEEIFSAERTTTLGYTADTIRKQFTGYERDNETDLDFAQARFYSKNIGRFFSVDMVMPDLSFPQTLNQYRYALNNPLRYVDKNGTYEEDVHYELTVVLAHAAGFSEVESNFIALADQTTDDHPSFSPMPPGNFQARYMYHFTDGEQRKSDFERAANSIQNSTNPVEARVNALALLGIYLHAKQDSYSHRGFGFVFGHLFAGHAPDKTYNDPKKANEMAEDTYNRLMDAAKRFGPTATPVPFDNSIRKFINNFNRSRSDSRKRRALQGLGLYIARRRIEIENEEKRKEKQKEKQKEKKMLP